MKLINAIGNNYIFVCAQDDENELPDMKMELKKKVLSNHFYSQLVNPLD